MFKMEQIDLDFDSSLEPFRGRSNTWPLPRPDLNESFGCGPDGSDKSDGDNNGLLLGNGLEPVIPTTAHEAGALEAAGQSGPGGAAAKKNTSRRNAWGNMSYADLITQAIQGTQDKRLTLSQIYDWMVQNVPYFKDKGDSNSSAGWKVRKNI